MFTGDLKGLEKSNLPLSLVTVKLSIVPRDHIFTSESPVCATIKAQKLQTGEKKHSTLALIQVKPHECVGTAFLCRLKTVRSHREEREEEPVKTLSLCSE